MLSEITSYGYVKQSFDALVDGVAGAIERAHKALRPGRLLASQGKLHDANINRSPSSYERNPQSERDEYEDGDTDKTMLQLRFEAEDGTQMGSINWFQVHGTSMNKTNTLVSGDNRGYASYLYEKEMGGADVDAGKGDYVAAFAATNLGDVSPNTAGPKCLDTGLPCDRTTSTCNGRTEMCAAFGPGTNGDMFESTEIIGRKQYDHAKKLAQQGTEVSGAVDYRHAFLDMFDRNVTLDDGSEVSTCDSAALGYGFAAGTTDGCGMFDFTQGQNSTNPFWNLVSSAIAPPTKAQRACHSPKPILLNLNSRGIGSFPYDWEPRTVPIQVLRIGQLFIVSVPSEFTTMSGRRLRKAVRQVVENSGIVPKDTEVLVTIAGLGNSWNHYTTTYEEYQAQRYEAASTIYGPHTLSAYLQEFRRITNDLVTGAESASDPPPEDLTSKLIELNPGVIFDSHPLLHKYGAVRKDAQSAYKVGERVDVTFQSANPRNNLRTQDTFLTVERQDGDSWKRVATDGDWETYFRWKHTGIIPEISAESTTTVTWQIPTDAQAGTYRICHFGDYKEVVGQVNSFSGCSSSFTVGKATLV
jgi:neutral ceramidase